MWFPEMFSRMQKYGGTPCNLGHINITQNSTSNETCEEPGNQVYLEGFLTSVSNFPGSIVSIFFMDRLGRKFLLCESEIYIFAFV